MKYGITSDQEDWTDRDIIVTMFSDGTACPRNKAGYISHKRTSLGDSIQTAEKILVDEAHKYHRIIIHLLDGAELPEDVI
ncbi:hypothetical protein M8994_09085 [Brucella sp. 21LCYQ03]|nr:hypothetical protein [Brucella sp. 21LCYQ03]